MSDICKNWSQWLHSTRFSYMNEEQMAQTLNWLNVVKDFVLNNAEIKPNDTVIDLGTGTGLLGFGVAERLNTDGKIIFSDKFEDCLVECQNFAKTLDIPAKYDFLQSGCEKINLANESVDKAVMRSVLVHILDKQAAMNEIYRILKPEGIFSAFEPIIRSNTRYYELIAENEITDYSDFKQAETELMTNMNDPLTNFDENSLAQNLDEAGFKDATIDVQATDSSYIVLPNTVESWFSAPPSPGTSSMKEKFLTYFEEPKVNRFINEVKETLTGKEITVRANVVLIKAIKN